MSPRTAIIADWLPVYGGAEHVITELHALWPDAPIFTTIARPEVLGPLRSADIRTTELQRWYTLTGKHQWLLPWMLRSVEQIDLRDFDVIISSSHAVAKGIIPQSSAVHICYCHTPMRYAWEMEEEYLRDFRIPKIILRKIRDKLKTIRRWDMTTAKRVDHFIANSTTTQERIKRIYDRESTVIHPPVEERFFEIPKSKDQSPNSKDQSPKSKVQSPKSKDQNPNSYYLAVGRFVPYKRFDLLIETANALKLPLKIAGKGQDDARLRALAGPTIEFLGYVPDADMPSLYADARALLHPQFEDAGVTALEAQACGTPVIAYGKGGALDSIRDGETGLFFAEQTSASLGEALERFNKLSFNAERIREHARIFSTTNFQKRMREYVEKAVTEHVTAC